MPPRRASSMHPDPPMGAGIIARTRTRQRRPGGNYSFGYTHKCVRSHTEERVINSDGDTQNVTVCDFYSANAKRWTFGDPIRAVVGTGKGRRRSGRVLAWTTSWELCPPGARNRRRPPRRWLAVAFRYLRRTSARAFEPAILYPSRDKCNMLTVIGSRLRFCGTGGRETGRSLCAPYPLVTSIHGFPSRPGSARTVLR